MPDWEGILSRAGSRARRGADVAAAPGPEDA
jgi:hypothetical protein